MRIEELIYNRLSGYDPLTNTLAHYTIDSNKKSPLLVPAIYYQQAPHDTQGAWKDGIQYPRITYTIDTQIDAARKTAGALTISVYCDEAGTAPEAIEPLVREALSGVLFAPADRPVCACAWNKSEAFELSTKASADTRIIGVDIRLDVLEYPVPDAPMPDPVRAIIAALSAWQPGALILGKAQLPAGVAIITDDKPAIYVESISRVTEYRTRYLHWVSHTIKIHVMAPSMEARTAWAVAVAAFLQAAYRIDLMDGGEAIIRKTDVYYITDYMRDGQIELELYYSVPIKPVDPHILNHIHYIDKP